MCVAQTLVSAAPRLIGALFPNLQYKVETSLDPAGKVPAPQPF